MSSLSEIWNGLGKKTKVFLWCFSILAILSPLISNDKPILCVGNGISFPIFNNQLRSDCEFEIKTLIPYSHNTIDRSNRGVSPLSKQETSSLYYRHWLGTDTLGRDVLAGMFRGLRISFFVGFISLLLALILGSLLAYFSAIIGDHDYNMSVFQFIALLFALILSVYSLIYASVFQVILVVIFFVGLHKLLARYAPMAKHRIYMPFDSLILRLIELFKSIPSLFLLLFFISVFSKASYFNVILIIALISWPSITRFLRAELLNIREQEYFLAAESMGLTKFQMFYRHALRNAIQPVLVALAFGFAATILLEATLSFLGLGIPTEEVSWGSMLNDARKNFRLWWMVLFPGLAIFIAVVSLNKLGEELTEAGT